MLKENQKLAILDAFDFAKVTDEKASAHVDSLDHFELDLLATLYNEFDIAIELKRSGTGITMNFSNCTKESLDSVLDGELDGLYDHLSKED